MRTDLFHDRLLRALTTAKLLAQAIIRVEDVELSSHAIDKGAPAEICNVEVTGEDWEMLVRTARECLEALEKLTKT